MQPASRGDLVRFQHDRFGLFVHWGVYAMWGINEWCLKSERIAEADYRFLVEHFGDAGQVAGEINDGFEQRPLSRRQMHLRE